MSTIHRRPINEQNGGCKVSDGTFCSLVEKNPPKIHLADRRRAVTVCGVIVGADQIGTYAESLLILGDKMIVRREVFSGFERVRRAYRCKCCFRRVERML